MPIKRKPAPPPEAFVKPTHVKRTVWLNCYPWDITTAHPDKFNADFHAKGMRLACVPVEVDVAVGEGVEKI